MKALYTEMNAQETKESKLYKALDKLEALIQHNESPIDTWSENEYELNKTYAFENVEFSEWLMELRKEILQDTIDKIESEKPDIQKFMAGLDKLHTTKMGAERIQRNLNLDCDDVVLWFRQKIMEKDADISRKGKNWYIKIAGCEITVNANSYTIITAHEI